MLKGSHLLGWNPGHSARLRRGFVTHGEALAAFGLIAARPRLMKENIMQLQKEAESGQHQKALPSRRIVCPS